MTAFNAGCYALLWHHKGRTQVGAITPGTLDPKTTLLAETFLPYFIPFGVSLAVAGILRLVLGPDSGARAAGIGVLIGFAAAWHWLLLAPWVPYDALSRVMHIMIGGVIIGLSFDFLQIKRLWFVVIIAGYGLGSIWSTLTGALLGPPPDEMGGWLRFGFYGVVWLLLLYRLAILRQEGPSALVTVLMFAAGLGLVGHMSGEGSTAATAYCLAAALAGYLALVWFLALPVGNVTVIGGGGAILALSMALVEPESNASLIALAFLLLVPFADGTAKRFPLGPAAMRPALYPLALITVTILPISVAAIIAFVLAGR